MGVTRVAGVDDVAPIMRLRAAMFDEWRGRHPADGVLVGDVDADWLETASSQLRDGLAADRLIAAVVDDEAGTPIAMGIASVGTKLASPGNPTGRIGHVTSMFTDPAHRGRGYGAAIVQRLIDELHARDLTIIELFAAPLAEPMYRRLGFDDRPGGTPLRLR